MNYVILVSHGTFCHGLRNALCMLVGDREDIISVGLEDGMSADEFAAKFVSVIDPITADDKIVLLGDLIGGSPLTNAINQISEKGLETQTLVFGGMNLGMALTAVLQKDMGAFEDMKESLVAEAKNIIQEYPLCVEDSGDDDDDI